MVRRDSFQYEAVAPGVFDSYRIEPLQRLAVRRRQAFERQAREQRPHKLQSFHANIQFSTCSTMSTTRSRGPNGRYVPTTDPRDGGEDNEPTDANVDSSADTAPEPPRDAGAVGPPVCS